MKSLSPILLIALVSAACSDDTLPSILKQSKGIATESIELRAYADVHTHLSPTGGDNETHTTVRVELAGEDDGFLYNIELSGEDELSVEEGNKTTKLSGEPYPSAASKLAVIYSEDFENTEMGTVFSVSLDRTAGAEEAGPIPITLLEDAAFSVLPAADTITLKETISVEWTETKDYSYELTFQFRCEDADGRFISATARFPNQSVTSISSPFTFSPSNFFSEPSSDDIERCKLHSSLYSTEKQEAPKDTNLSSVSVSSTRQHHTEKVVRFTESGGASADAGSPSTDAGTTPDAGSPSTDAGTTPDAGSPSTDAGTTPDAGSPSTDAGTTPDAGSPSTDAGSPTTDASTTPDASPPIADAG